MSVKFECSHIMSRPDDGAILLMLTRRKMCDGVFCLYHELVCQETVKDTSYVVKYTKVITKKKKI